METFVGVADCYGVESFLKKDSEPSSQLIRLKMRADLNRQRHAIFYEADLDDNSIKKINLKIDKQLYEDAFNVMRKEALSLRVPIQHSNSLNLIPNPKLDPYGDGK